MAAAQRSRRADLEQEILLVERQLSATARRVTPETIERLGGVTLTKLRSPDDVIRQGCARLFGEPTKPQEFAVDSDLEQQAPPVPFVAREWCRLQDSNL